MEVIDINVDSHSNERIFQIARGEGLSCTLSNCKDVLKNHISALKKIREENRKVIQKIGVGVSDEDHQVFIQMLKEEKKKNSYCVQRKRV